MEELKDLNETDGGSNKKKNKDVEFKKVEKDKKNKQKNKKKNIIDVKWVLQVFLISFSVGAIFSVISEIVLSDANIIIVILVITILLFINIVFDIIGMAFASAKEEPFLAMASKKVKGAKKAIKLLKNANKVSSFCQDIMGDICGIISGAAGTTAVVVIAGNSDATTLLITSTIISGLIAALTIAGKAATKKIAMKNSTPIVIFVGRVLSGLKKEK